MGKKPKRTCLVCEVTDQQAPLVRLVYRGERVWICAQHLPVLIHNAEELAEKLAKIGEPG